MRTSFVFGMMVGLLAAIQPAAATVNSDSAANYGGVWTNGSNGGGGFGAWSIAANAGSGWAGNGIWASSNADLGMGDAFAYVAKGDGAYITLDRPFLQRMTTGDVFSLDLGLNYDAGADGNKGFVLRTADNREIVVVNQAGSQVITVNGGGALTNYGTTTMHWTFTQVSATQLMIYATGRSGAEAYSAFVGASTASYISNIHFYASGITNDAYAELRQVYFDNLTLSQGNSGTNTFAYSIEDGRAIITGVATGTSGALAVPSTLGGYPVTGIGRAAFKDCTNVTDISFVSGAIVTNLGASAFQGCSRLVSMALPSGVTAIPPALFQGCTGLVSVTIPSGVTSIGEGAFADCFSLSSITLPAGLASIGESAFLNCRGLTLLQLPGVSSVPGQLCYECRTLATLALASGVTNIGYSAFYNCFRLQALSLPDSLKTLGSGAFAGCEGLTSETINSALTSVGNEAFYGCTNLESLYFYGGVSSLGVGVFGGCGSLAGVFFLCNVPGLGSDGGADMFTGDPNVVAYYLTNPSSWGATFCGVQAQLWQPLVADTEAATNGLTFEVEWASGRNVRMQTCTNLSSPQWVDLGTNLVTAGSCLFRDTNWVHYDRRYYRVTATN